jgi:hypothetical protein
MPGIHAFGRGFFGLHVSSKVLGGTGVGVWGTLTHALFF